MLVGLALLSACALRPGDGTPRDPSDPTSVQVLFGVSELDDGVGTAETRMPVVGIAGQLRSVGDRRLEAGIDGMLAFAWWEDRDVVLGGAGASYVSTRLWTVDLALGAYASAMLGDGLRAYAGLGPLLQLAEVRQSDDFGTAHDRAFGFGAYARAGLELRVGEDSFLGIGLRRVETDHDFDGLGGSVDTDALELMFSFTKLL